LQQNSKFFLVSSLRRVAPPRNALYAFASTPKVKGGIQKLTPELTPEELEEEYKELTKEEIKRMIIDRKAQIEEMVKEKSIPYGALFSGLMVTAPVIIGACTLNYFCMTNTFLESMPMFFMNYVKYAGLHASFMAGIHWGFAMSEHDCQPDSENSSPQVRRDFFISALPLFISFALTGNLVYAFGSLDTQAKLLHIGGLVAVQLGIYVKDWALVKNKKAPIWYGRLKFWITLFSIASILSISNIILNYDDKIKVRSNPYRKVLSSNVEGAVAQKK